MKTLLLTLVLLAAAVVLLGVKVLFVKGAKFPSGHAHDLPGLHKAARKPHHSEYSK